MKCQTVLLASIALTAVVSCVSASAVECTPAQNDAIHNAGTAPIKKACPAFGAEGAANPTNYDTFTNATLAKITSCKEKPCIAALTQLVADTPECLEYNTSVKILYKAAIKVCEGFNDGPLTAEKATAIYSAVLIRAWDAMQKGDGSSVGASKNTSSSSSPSPSVPSPMPTTSAASVATRAGAVVAATTTIALSCLY